MLIKIHVKIGRGMCNSVKTGCAEEADVDRSGYRVWQTGNGRDQFFAGPAGGGWRSIVTLPTPTGISPTP